jgi:hypothetical protein
MTHHEHHEKKKLKKLQQLLHNKRHLLINQQAETLEKSRQLDKEREEKLKASALASSRAAEKKAGKAEPVWSAKMQEIRDRNTGRTHMAKERWNRFAGTAESGGRGL